MQNQSPPRWWYDTPTWWAAAVGIAAVATFVFCVRLGDRAVVSEEVRWAEVAREMRESGDYLHPTVNGQTYYDKPAGSYWLIVAASHITGRVDETAARLPAAVAGVVGVWVVMLLGRRLYDPRTALLAGGVLATCYGFAFYARRATADVETVTGVLVAVWWYARHQGRPGGLWVVGLWAWMAAVSLTKGLLGFALPGVVFASNGLWTAWAERGERFSVRGMLSTTAARNRWLFSPWVFAAVPLAAAVYLLPFLFSLSETGDGIGLEMVWRENVQRFVAPHNHTGPIYLYFGVIFVLAAPWALFLPAAVVPATGEARTPGDRLARAFFWAVFVFFTLAASRRSYYLLPVLPPAALLVSRVLTAGPSELTGVARFLCAAAWVAGGVGVLLAGVVLVPAEWRPHPYDQLGPLPAHGWLVAGWLAATAAILTTAFLPPVRWPAVAVAGVILAFVVGFGVVYPAADDLRTRREFLAVVREQTAADPSRLGLFHASDTVFDLRRRVPEYSTSDELITAASDGRLIWLLLPRRRLADLPWPATVAAEEPVQPWETADNLGNKLVLLDVPGGRAGGER